MNTERTRHRPSTRLQSLTEQNGKKSRGLNAQTRLLAAPLTPLLLQKPSTGWRRGNKTSLLLLISASPDIGSLDAWCRLTADPWSRLAVRADYRREHTAQWAHTRRRQIGILSVLYTDKKTDRAIILKNVQVYTHTRTQAHINPYTSLTGALNRPHSDLPACLAASPATESS